MRCSCWLSCYVLAGIKRRWWWQKGVLKWLGLTKFLDEKSPLRGVTEFYDDRSVGVMKKSWRWIDWFGGYEIFENFSTMFWGLRKIELLLENPLRPPVPQYLWPLPNTLWTYLFVYYVKNVKKVYFFTLFPKFILETKFQTTYSDNTKRSDRKLLFCFEWPNQ